MTRAHLEFSFRHRRSISPLLGIDKRDISLVRFFAVKPLRTVKPSPRDPDWQFPYASRERMAKIRAYFLALPHRARSWTTQNRKSILNDKERATLEPWAQVPVKHRDRVEKWFNMKVAQLPPHRRTVAKIRSLRGNAINYGRHVLTGHRRANKSQYDRNKRLWLTFQEWQEKELQREVAESLPRTRSKLLEVA